MNVNVNQFLHPDFLVLLSGIDCGPPPQIKDGSVQCSDTTSNGMAEYKCKKGFLLVGSSTMVCQSDGKTAKWSALDDTESAPVCKRTLFDVCYILGRVFAKMCYQHSVVKLVDYNTYGYTS